MADLPRLVVVGGSSADGYGVEPHQAYATMVASTVGRTVSAVITPALRMKDAAEMVGGIDLSSDDILLLHVGLVDTTPRMPRRWYAIVKATRRGRGSFAQRESDRRLWSRVRRRLSGVTENGLVRAARLLHVDRPVTDVDEYRRMCTEVARTLQPFMGLAIVMVAERGPSVGTRHEPVARTYAAMFRGLVVDARKESGAPVLAVDLSEILADGDYLEDEFHPNASGHRHIADACLRGLQQELSVTPHHSWPAQRPEVSAYHTS